MVSSETFLKRKGFTLMELLIVIAVSSILVGVITFTLKTSLDIFNFVQDDIFLQKSLDDMFQEMVGGDYKVYGIKDSLEIVQATATSITFVPPWVDDGHTVKSPLHNKQQFVFNRPIKSGASLPLGEVLEKNSKEWRAVQIVVFLDEEKKRLSLKNKAILNEPVPAGSKVRFIYHPETEGFPDTKMTIEFLDGKIMRHYKGKSEVIPKDMLGDIVLQDAKFQYFDNTNTEILPDASTGNIASKNILNITAIKITLKISAEQTKQGSVFINLRNTSSAGASLIIREGTELRISNSKDIRAFSLLNISGVKEGDRIVLQAESDHGETWRANIELGIKNNLEVIKRYTIEYPVGKVIYSDNVNLSAASPLSFLTSSDGSYDYDWDEDANNIVNLEGKVTLSVIRMDADGAALFVRP